MAENEKKILTRIINKNASLSDWDSSSLVLKKGEIALAYVETTKPDGHGGYYTVPTYLMKVGDGQKTFKQLQFVAAPASDVYQWAKQANKPTYTAAEIGNGESTVAADISTLVARVAAAEEDISTLSGGVEGVSALITAAINALDVTDAAVEKQFVTAVSEADGKISVTRRALSADDIPTLTVSKLSNFTAEVNKLVNAAVGTESAARASAIGELDTAYKAADTALGGRIDGAIGRIKALEDIDHDAYATKTAVQGIDGRLQTAEGTIEEIEQDIIDLTTSVGTNLQSAKSYTDDEIAKEVIRANGAYDAKGSAATAEQNAKNYADQIKATILGENDKLVSTYDTLSEIGQWIDNTGSNVTDLATTIANMDAAYKAADATLTAGVNEAKAAAEAAQGAADDAQADIDAFKQGHSYTDTQIDTKVADAKAAGTGAKTYAEGVAQDLADHEAAFTTYQGTVSTELGKKLDTATYNTDKATFATTSAMNTALAGKVDKTTYEGKVEEIETSITNGLAGKVDNSTYATDKAAINKAISDGDTALSTRITAIENKKFVEYDTTTVYVLDCGGIE